jgi:hypothetical protein
MATHTVVTYTCDGCESKVQRRELRKVLVSVRSMDNAELTGTARADLCPTCRENLLTVLSDFVTDPTDIALLREAMA